MRDNLQTGRSSIEKTILVVYSIYTLLMTVVAIILSWKIWIPVAILCGMAVCWWAFLKKYRDFRFRSFLTATMAWMNFIFYGVSSSEYFNILATMAALVVLLGIYCIPEIMYISMAGSTFLLLFHIFVTQDIHFTGAADGYLQILRIAAVYLVEYVTYHLIKTQIATNKRLMENIEALNAAERSKDDFVANVSHEIRTPINTICGMSELLLRENLETGVRSEVFDIQTAGRNLLSIVSDILDFSELESGKIDLVEEEYIITSTINDVMNMTNAQLSGKNIELIVNCDADIPSGLVGDEQKIRRAIMNLVSNAVKFTSEGCVIISISSRREQYGINLIISVKDTGIGMDEVQLEKLFSSFNQVDTKRNRQEGGIGLGLAIANAIVTKMNGFITVKSTPGQGSEFQIVIPQKVVNDTPIISVRDEEIIDVIAYINMEKYAYAAIRDGYADCIRRMVQQFGFHVRQCRNLAELKRRVEKGKYSHVVICWEEYSEDKAWFDQLAERMPVLLVLDRQYEAGVSGKLLRIYKPFYALAVASVLNGEHVYRSVGYGDSAGSRFIAPTASILVVDDNMMNLKVVEGLLRPYQIKVFAAYSGKEALEKIENMDYDFVFMDHMMPEMDGVETLHRIRQKPGKYFQTVPIIALTANAIGGAREMFLAEGFQDFVAKPIELSVMERVLLRYIPERKVIRAQVEQGTEALAEAGSAAASKSDFPGIDVARGVSYCGGNFDDYLEVVQVYYNTGLVKKKDIQEYYRQKDWKNYSILVHAVKSTSQGIGAMELSDMARELEQAGKNGEEEFIHSHHAAMMEEYERVLDVLGRDKRINSGRAANEEKGIGQTESTAPAVNWEQTSGEQSTAILEEIEREQLEALLFELQESLDTFESEAVDRILEKMRGYQYRGEVLEQLMESVREKVSVFNFIDAGEELSDIRERLV